jgi:hypothetical protein
MRKVAVVWMVFAILAVGASATGQTTAPEATVPPVPTEPDVEAPTVPPVEAPEDTAEPTQDPVVPGTTTDNDDDDDGLSSNTILLLIIGGVVLVLIAFAIAMSQRRSRDPDAPV